MAEEELDTDELSIDGPEDAPDMDPGNLDEISPDDDDAEERDLTLEERNTGIIDIKSDQATGMTSVEDLGAGAVDLATQDVEEDELLDTTDKTLTEDLDVTAAQVEDIDEEDFITPQTDLPTGADKASIVASTDLERTSASIPSAVNVEGVLSSDAQITEANVLDSRTKETMLSDGTLAVAATQDLASEATVKYQLEKIYEALEEGKPLPAWAAPNVRKVQEIMNSRGLGASSVAAAAMVQAIGESALPIAIEDANKYATIQITNLTNEQQTALANAATIAAIDLKNLDNKMIAAKHNAESFLKMDLLNVTNEQASNIIEYQSNVQALFNDASAENLRLQFNAKTETQVNEFYDQLGATVSKNNLDRETATHQFNVDQENSVTKYMSKLEDSREKFNANMQHLIDQSNAVWRRTISTANNATENEESRLNASALLGMTVQAQNDLWQQYRDEAAFLFQATANDLQRTHQLAMVVIANQFAESMFEAQIDAEDSAQISMFFGDMLKGVFERAMDSVFTGDTESDVADTGDASVDPTIGDYGIDFEG